ncbi:type I BMP receptor saxophone isoform X2 [Augochlora pura]
MCMVMADFVFIMYFILLLVFELCTGEKETFTLAEHDFSSENEESQKSIDIVDINDNSAGYQRLKCYICEGPDCSYTKFCHNAVTCWKSKVKQSDGTISVSRGCTSSVDQMLLICNKQQPLHANHNNNNNKKKKRHVSGPVSGIQYFVECCQTDFCNGGPFPILQDYSGDAVKEDYTVKLTLAILGLMVGFCVIAGGLLFYLLVCRARRKRPLTAKRNKLVIESELESSYLHFSFSSPTSVPTCPAHELRATAAGDSTLKEYLDGRSLTSGSGSGLPLLVQRTLAKQVSLVECLGNGGNGGFGGEVWRGVWHEIHGTRGKPAMAHRNLKSKNILVKTNGSCVIADFALAVTQDRLSTDRIDLKLGTKRYMSPEILEQTINMECLENFRRSDIYSLGLVLWEVCRRCISNGVALEYMAPYSEWLPSNQEPSIEEMRKLVCLDHRRPPLPNRWHSDSTLAGLGKLMKECWHGKSAARLPVLRVKKTLVKLAANDSRVHLPLD